MTGVIYARYSSDNQRDESIDGQIRECQAFAERQGISIVDHYIDRAFSAKTDKRPAFQKMIRDSEKQKFDKIIVWKLDRFARNRYDSAMYKNKLKKNNVTVASATETISSTSEGILLESILEGYAEYYSAELAEKVTRGMTGNALKCQFNGGNIPIGYKITEDKHFELDPEKAPLVLEAFKAYAGGLTIQEAVDMLNEKGLTTTRGNPVTFNIVTNMLKNRRYIGEYRFKDVVMPDGIPRIVPQELFDLVQIQREKNKRASARHKAEEDYLLTTKLFCGKCNALMVGECGTGHNGTVYRYYKCGVAKRKRKCDKKAVKKDWIEDLVVRYTKQMLMDDNVIEDIVSIVLRNLKQENSTLVLLRRQLTETQTSIKNIMDAIEDGIRTATTKQRLIELEKTQNELEIKIVKEELRRPNITKEELTFWLKRFQQLDTNKKEHKQRLIDSFVNAVFIYDDKIVLTFNYKEANKTVTLSEVNGSIIECKGSPKGANTNRRTL